MGSPLTGAGLKYSMGLKNLVNNLLYYIYLLC